MKKGDLVNIYFHDRHSDRTAYEVGLVIHIDGYKVDVLRSGHVEVWDKSDLENMERFHREMERMCVTENKT